MEKLKKKVIMMGGTGVGKTSLCQFLDHQDIQYNKTQAVEMIGGKMVDTPGEFTELTWRFGSLQVMTTDVDLILFLHSANSPRTLFPPQFATMFTKPAIGVVTKIDIADEHMINLAQQHLVQAGARKVFPISAVTGEGVESLLSYINED